MYAVMLLWKVFMEIEPNKLTFFKIKALKNKNPYEGLSPEKLLNKINH